MLKLGSCEMKSQNKKIQEKGQHGGLWLAEKVEELAPVFCPPWILAVARHSIHQESSEPSPLHTLDPTRCTERDHAERMARTASRRVCNMTPQAKRREEGGEVHSPTSDQSDGSNTLPNQMAPAPSDLRIGSVGETRLVVFHVAPSGEHGKSRSQRKRAASPQVSGKREELSEREQSVAINFARASLTLKSPQTPSSKQWRRDTPVHAQSTVGELATRGATTVGSQFKTAAPARRVPRWAATCDDCPSGSF